MSNLANKEIMARNLQHYMDSYGIDRKRLANDLILIFHIVRLANGQNLSKN